VLAPVPVPCTHAPRTCTCTCTSYLNLVHIHVHDEDGLVVHQKAVVRTCRRTDDGEVHQRDVCQMDGIDGVKHDENLGDRALLLPLACSCVKSMSRARRGSRDRMLLHPLTCDVDVKDDVRGAEKTPSVVLVGQLPWLGCAFVARTSFFRRAFLADHF
jgi:hypothetical protein